MELLEKYLPADKREQENFIFGFNSSDNLARNLTNKIKKIVLPSTSSIDVKKWHTHSLRTSMITHLRTQGWRLE